MRDQNNKNFSKVNVYTILKLIPAYHNHFSTLRCDLKKKTVKPFSNLILNTWI